MPWLGSSPTSGTFSGPRSLAPVTASLGVRKIALDPGHGGNDSGARASQGIWEKEVTLEVARELRALLRHEKYDVAMTRDRDAFVSLRQRAQLANAERADLFVSIHVNSVPSRECHAVETYFLGQADDPRAEQLAGKENRDSGYHLADFRRLLEGVYTSVRQAESRKLAHAVQHELVSVLGDANPAIRDKGVRSAPFLVLVATESPGILAEVSCLSNDEEAARLADPAYRQRIARALFLGIHAYAEARNRVATLGQAQGASR
jgi:N-acetylmuramoyl-L-alanine amidase